MRMKTLWLVLLLTSPGLARAQDVKLPADVEKLCSQAKETVEVNMDGPMLRWASKFLSSEDPEEAKCTKVGANLKGIYVGSFEFDKEGAYSPADVEALRSQFHPPFGREWSASGASTMAITSTSSSGWRTTRWPASSSSPPRPGNSRSSTSWARLRSINWPTWRRVRHP